MTTLQPAPSFPANARPLLRAVSGLATSDGAGVRLTRVLGQPALPTHDPFLMLDAFGSNRPEEFLAGFPDHPHRGFETVTYLIEGRVRHADNHGHQGVIAAGGVQWMTAGRGLVHSEMPEREDGRLAGFQLWINLPARLKMCAPAYQEFPAAQIPIEERAGGARVKVIAGSTAAGASGPVQAEATEAQYFDVTLPAGALFEEPAPKDHVVLAVVFEGSLLAPDAERPIEALAALVLGEGERVAVRAGSAGARFLLLSGRPIGEPIAWAGPFVMNTREEVLAAYRDYEEGRM